MNNPQENNTAPSDRGDLGVVWEVVAAAFAPHEPPSTLLGVTALGYDHQLVEVEAVAALPSRDVPPRRQRPPRFSRCYCKTQSGR